MPFDLGRFAHLRPFVYHSTDRANLSRIARLRCLEPAANLIRHAGRLDLLRLRRRESVTIHIDGEPIVLRDQKPLLLANANLADGWTEGDFVLFQNKHVFFWPGGSTTIVTPGLRLLSCYDERDAVLRIPSPDLLVANAGRVPLFCAFNSGAPRKQRGKAVPRGPTLFAPAPEFPRAAGQAVEMAFACSVELPSGTELRMPDGSWRGLLRETV